MSFINFLFDPIILLIITLPIVAFIFLLVGIYVSQPRKNRIQQIAPESGRGKDYEVKHEDAVYMECDPIENEPPQHFVKTGQAFNMIRKGFLKVSNYALWIGRMGTGYTYALDDKNVEISFKDSLITLFTRKTYDKLSEELKKKIEEAKLGVIVKFPDVSLTPSNPNYDPNKPVSDSNLKYLPSVSSDDVRRGAIDHFITRLAEGIHRLDKGGSRTNMLQIFLALGSGGCLVSILLLMTGHIK